MNYTEFLENKKYKAINKGIEIDRSNINDKLFDFQKDVTYWALRKGRAAIFLDTGLGKTFIQLEWLRLISSKGLIIAPLSVARQTVREAKKININISYIRKQSDFTNGNNLYITNYEMIDNIDISYFDAIVLDESSILKSIGGGTRNKLFDKCKDISYRLCCTAHLLQMIMLNWVIMQNF